MRNKNKVMSSMGAFNSNSVRDDGNSNDEKRIDFILCAQHASYLRNFKQQFETMILSSVNFDVCH